jgi:hypothetical protein
VTLQAVPRSLPSPAARLDADPEARSCTIYYIRRELGRFDYGDRRLVTYVQGLIDNCGFPPPWPVNHKRNGITRAVTPESRWPRAAVDAWLDEWTPPGLAMAIDAKAMAAAATDMDAAAAGLARLPSSSEG